MPKNLENAGILGLGVDGTMDAISFESGLPDKSRCLVCGSHSLANYVDLSLGSSRTSRSDTLIKNKLHHILMDSWVTADNEVILCFPCFHLVDQFDVLETQLDAIRKDLTDKYVGRGFRGEVPSPPATLKKAQTEAKKKRRPYVKKKKPSYDDLNSYILPDNVLLNQQLGHCDVAQSNPLAWSQDPVELQQIGDVTATEGWKKSTEVAPVAEEPPGGPTTVTVYEDDLNFLNAGERLRIGIELNENEVVSLACVYCERRLPSVDVLKTHFHVEHFPKVLPAQLPSEAGLSTPMNCGVQLGNVTNAPPDSAKPFACVFCDSAFKVKSNLALHFKEKHTPHKPFSCVDCLEGFRRSMELSRHKVYYCPYRKKNLARNNKKTK